MARPPRYFLVCYDICDDKRLRAVYKTMRGFGDPLQYSVFLCRLSDMRRVELDAQLGDILNHDVDQVMIVDLGPEGALDRFAVLGAPLDRPERAIRVV